MRAFLFIVGGPLVGAAAGFLLGSVFNSGIERTLREELTVYTVGGAIAGLLLGITLAILAFARSVRDSDSRIHQTASEKSTTAEGQWKRHPVVQFIIVIAVIIFVVRLIMIITLGL